MIIFLVIFVTCGNQIDAQVPEKRSIQNTDSIEQLINELWIESSFKETVPYHLFFMAMKGFYKEQSFTPGKIAIIDYTKPSTEKRFYVIDLKNKTLLYNTLIAHGKNTGENIPLSFSNKPKSLKSSLGFFKTAGTYMGKHGFSMRLDGLEKGINDNARQRAIVIHGANYVNPEFIKKHGRLGRSWGCPALPISKTKEIINTISNGTCLFIYGNNEAYLKSSKFIY